MAANSSRTTTPPATGTPRNTANPLATFGTGGGGNQPPGGDTTQAPDLSGPYNSNPDAFGLSQQDVTVKVPVDRGGMNIIGSPGAVGTPGVIQYDLLPHYMASIEKLDPDHLKVIQQQLFNAGYYPSGYYSSSNPSYVATTGVPDQAFKSALKQAALDATSSQGQFTVGEMLQQRAQGLASAGGNQVRPYQTNTQNIADAVKAIGPQFLGKDVPDTVVNQIVGRLHGAEDAAAQGKTGTEQAVSGDQSWYEEQLKELMPNTYQAFQEGQGFQTINKLVGGTGSAYHG